MKNIGIMGGTFNPIHIGHIEIARAAYEQYQLDEIWFMPNHIPAYKSNEGIVSCEHRLNMISLAIKDYDYFKLSDLEITREGKTYSYQTFTLLKQQYPDIKFYFIMGADSLFYFDKWIHPEIILENTDVLVASRNNNGIEQINERISILEDMYPESHFYVIKCDNTDCSSSELRNHLHLINENNEENDAALFVKQYIPASVYEYIINNRLY